MPNVDAKKENLLANIAFSCLMPAVLMAQLSKEHRLGPEWGLVVALMFPIGYILYDFGKRRKTSFIAIIGFTSILLTGGLNLMKVSAFWIAVKEASIPLIIGAAVLISLRSKRPLVQEMLYNDQIMDVPRVDAALAERGNDVAFKRLLVHSSLWLGGSFVISAVLNFFLAQYLLKSPPGTPEFNAELGRMYAWSWPIIVGPSTIIMMIAFWRLLGGLKKLTGLSMDEIFRAEQKK